MEGIGGWLDEPQRQVSFRVLWRFIDTVVDVALGVSRSDFFKEGTEGVRLCMCV